MNSSSDILGLGDLKGKLLVFGGPYSNLQALEELKRMANEHEIPPQSIICTGDIIGYCAQPEETVQLVKSWGIHCIQGNVEQNIIEGEDSCGCNFTEGSRCDLFSRTWFPYAVSSVSAASKEWLTTLPLHLTFRYAGRSVAVVHGSAQHISQFVFKSTPWSVKEETFRATGAEVVLAGHAGLPFAEVQQDLYWLNAGVIGMPANDGTPRVWYLLLDDADGHFTYTFRSFEYNNRLANQLMMQHQLPDSYARTLLTGIWDNCEILPEAEKQLQGEAIGLDSDF
ncbi:metallophosphoesterase family protein [Telluribacter humicola]|uniref:metallophosphoesterase family protein n=1 Tax=Telluribacter humicola TaxID=1720261 RepID=UPI001A962B55|nr:metallophosphoesterase family protein [Telluribacter humicola]